MVTLPLVLMILIKPLVINKMIVSRLILAILILSSLQSCGQTPSSVSQSISVAGNKGNIAINSPNSTQVINTNIINIHVTEKELNDLNITLEENFQVKYDPIKMTLECGPRIGKWEKPFVAVAIEEKETFKNFASKSQKGPHALGVLANINGVDIFGDAWGLGSYNDYPALADFLYKAEFNILPKYIIFGNYGNILYKLDTKTNKVSVFKNYNQ